MLGENVLEDCGDGLELRKQFEIEGFFAGGERFDRHVEAVHLIQIGNDFANRLAAPRVEKFLIVVAVPFGEGFLPGDVREGHRVGDGAVAVKEIGAEVAGGNFELHALGGTPGLAKRLCRRGGLRFRKKETRGVIVCRFTWLRWFQVRHYYFRFRQLRLPRVWWAPFARRC